MNHKNHKTGFTLIEIMIYITLVAGILITATSFGWNVINSRTKTFVIQEVEQNGRFIMNRITQMSRQATDINNPSTGNSDSRLELSMRDAGLDPIVFSLNSNDIEMNQAGGSFTTLNSSNVEVIGLTFDNISTVDGKSKNIQITLTLQHINPDSRQEWQYSNDFITSIELRD